MEKILQESQVPEARDKCRQSLRLRRKLGEVLQIQSTEKYLELLPGPTPQPRVAKCGSKINPCSYMGFSGTKWATSNRFIAPAQNTINPAWAT